ncbi:hypothetical protein Tco_1115431 [Tanacetum coccineum]
MPTTTNPINTTTTTNVSQSVVDENLPQLLDSRGGSHVINVPAFDKADFTSWEVRFLVFLDGLEPYLLKTLEGGPFIPMSSLSTSENPLLKRQNRWSNAEIRLANQDKRLKSIIISYLLNDVIKSVIKCTTAKAMCTNIILAHELPSDIRDIMIAALRLKFNAFKALEGEKVNETFTRLKCLLNDLKNNGVSIPQAKDNDSDVQEDTRSSSDFLVDLNVEFHDRALLANEKRFYKRSRRVGSAKKPMDKMKNVFPLRRKGLPKLKNLWPSLRISVRKADARSDYTYVDIYYVEDQRKNLLSKFNSLSQELSSCNSCPRWKGKRKETISLKKVMFTKADESPSKTAIEIASDSESKCNVQEPLPPLPKLSRAEPIGTSADVITLADLTQTPTVIEEIKKVPDKRSVFKAPKKKAQTVSPTVPNPIPVKKADSSTEKLLLTLM